MGVRVLVRVNNRRVLADDAELRRSNAGTHDLLGPDGFGCDRETAQRAADIVERDAGVDQRAEHHVAGRAREAVEVQDPQIRTILRRRRAISHLREAAVPLR